MYLGLHNFHHLLSDKLLVGCFGVAGGFNLFVCLLCEGNAEHSKDVTIVRFSLDKSLNQRLPFLDHRASFVSGDIHSVEVREAVISLDFINLELELSKVLIFRFFVAVGKTNIEDTSS